MSFESEPPQPPSPPVYFLTMSHNHKPSIRFTTGDKFFDNKLCAWASRYPELRMACSRYGVFRKEAPSKYQYRHFNSLLQEGPTCGLVAISILIDHQVPIINLLQLAKDERYTNNGEMFSVKQAAVFLQTIIDNLPNMRHVQLEHRNGNIFCREVIDLLLDGCVMLVPYDSDCNHSPCQKKGHKAHWAILTGILIVDATDKDTMNADGVYVMAKQGKSLHLAVWKLKDLELSNQNLTEFGPNREMDDLEYVLPDGGLGGDLGLKGQYILIHPFHMK